MGIFFAFILFLYPSAWAQLDPSSAGLLNSSGGDQSLESNRYQVKPKPKSQVRPVERVRPKPSPTPTPLSDVEANPAPTPTPTPPKTIIKKVYVPVEKKKEASKEEDRIHISDPRLNLVQVSFAPGLMYMDSASPSWYRNYHSFSPNLEVNTDVWVSEKFGIYAGYSTSLAADITASPTSTEKTTAEHRNFGAGFKIRHFASHSRKSPSYVFGVGYDDYQMVLPRTATQRVRVSTSGAVIHMGAKLPLSLHHARLFSLDLLPRMSTDEESTTVTYSSGSLDSAHGVKISFGTEYIIDRKQQFFWKLSHRLDKHVYEGTSTGNDPITGGTLDGISVIQGTTFFQFGFVWGD